MLICQVRSPRSYNKIKIIVQGVHCLTNDADDLVIANLEEAIGDFVVRFPLLHCEECAKTLKRWLKQRGIPGKLWRLSTQYDYEDFILSDRLEQQGCSESITENGVHYGVEVYGKIFDNLSSQGLALEDWVRDFTFLSNEFKVEVIEEF